MEFDFICWIDVLMVLIYVYVERYYDLEDEFFCEKIFDKWKEVELFGMIEELKEVIMREI